MERSLKGAAIWDEVKDRLKKSALGMSGGQQQRLCIARAFSSRTRGFINGRTDPVHWIQFLRQKIEELVMELKKKYTIIIVTHNMQQALRISDRTAFFFWEK